MKIRIKHILRCYQSGMSIRSISSSLLVSRNTVKRYIRIYEDMGIELERLLKMDEQHLHELFDASLMSIFDYCLSVIRKNRITKQMITINHKLELYKYVWIQFMII